MIAGGVESMSRSPFVIGKAESAFGRTQEMYDTTMGWRFINKKLTEQYGTDVMPKTAENLAEDLSISREDQDQFAFWSQSKAAAAQQDGRLAGEICAVSVPQRKKDPLIVDPDEHPRNTSLEKLAQLRPLFPNGTVTAGMLPASTMAPRHCCWLRKLVQHATGWSPGFASWDGGCRSTAQDHGNRAGAGDPKIAETPADEPG